jgi:glycosyltransferase involved in cell wall biosynthesis
VTVALFPTLEPAGGGIYQYGCAVADALAEAALAGQVLTALAEGEEALPTLHGWQAVRYPAASRVPLWMPFIASPRHRALLRAIRRRTRIGAPPLVDVDAIRARPEVAAALVEAGVDLTLFPAPLPLSFEIGLPYVIAIHDLQHRLQPEFPEVSADGEWARREYLFRNGARYASIVLADSDVGREDILEAYGDHGLAEERVAVLPFVAPRELRAHIADADRERVRALYGLPSEYLFYPAQFWPHKNHLRLVEALGILRRRGIRVALVLSGSNSGELRARTYRTMVKRARALGVDEQVVTLGYVPQDDMAPLYAESLGLVFPTFFGPTNIPILEAWTVGCPVITSDIRGIREQVADAGLLADPRDPEEIAEAIERLCTDAELRERLSERGRERVRRFSPDDFRARLLESLERARELGAPAELWVDDNARAVSKREPARGTGLP